MAEKYRNKNRVVSRHVGKIIGAIFTRDCSARGSQGSRLSCKWPSWPPNGRFEGGGRQSGAVHRKSSYSKSAASLLLLIRTVEHRETGYALESKGTFATKVKLALHSVRLHVILRFYSLPVLFCSKLKRSECCRSLKVAIPPSIL